MNKLGFYRDKSNHLFVQDLNVNLLATKYGTPLFIYDAGLIEDIFVKIQNAVKNINGKIFYAIKANDNIGIIKFINNLGAGADVVSLGELKKCLKVGMKPNKIIFSGVGKDREEIAFAIQKKIKQLNIESEEELFDVIEIAEKEKKNIKVALRVNLDIKASTHAKISTGDEYSKFGISSSEILKVCDFAKKSKYVTLHGLAIHIGSQIFDYDLFSSTYSALEKLAYRLNKNGFNIKSLDLGGGFGVNYEKYNFHNFNELKKITEEIFLKKKYEICFEPGRSLIADSGILVTKIIRTKNSRKKSFLIVDAGMNHLIRPTLYNAFHRIEPIKLNDTRNNKVVDVVGPICETGDFFALDRKLQEMSKNELLAIMSTGAYGSVMSSNYNSQKNAKEILIYKGKDYLIKKELSFNELIKSHVIPNF